VDNKNNTFLIKVTPPFIADPERYGRLGQDAFAFFINGEKTNGTFVDIGCREPLRGNNTWILEERYNWIGISIDIEDYTDIWKYTRKNPFVQMDAIEGDLEELFSTLNVPDVVDYLTHDVDGAEPDRFDNIPFDKYIFKCITVEHDGDPATRAFQRNTLLSYGYELACSNVKNGPGRNCFRGGKVMEDWWIHPEYIEESARFKFASDELMFIDVFGQAGYDLHEFYNLEGAVYRAINADMVLYPYNLEKEQK